MSKKKSKETKPCHQAHPDYSKELKRLNRISGQVEGIKTMIGENRYCPDILAQLRAVRSAVMAVEANILEAHLESCVTDALSSKDKENKKQKLAELKDLYRRFSG